MRPVTVVWLVLLWAALWGDLAPGTVLAGLLVGVAVVVLCRTWLPAPATRPARRARPGRVAVLLGVFLRDLVVSSVSVARIVLRRNPAPEPAIVVLGLRSTDPVVAALVANGITLTPGTLTIDVDPDARRIEVHVLDLGDPEGPAAAALRADVAALEERAARAVGVTLTEPAGGGS